MKNIEILQNVGFTLYESKILLSLAKYQKAPVKLIEKDSLVPRNKVYEILYNLSKKGYIQIYNDKPKEYGVVNLKEIVNELLVRKEEKIKNLKIESKKMILDLKEDKYFEEKFWVMKGTDSMVNKIVETLETTKKESIGYVDVWVLKYSNLKSVKEAINRGVNFYFMGPIDKESLPIAKKYAEIGVEVRDYKIERAGYSIFDSKKVQLRVSENEVISLWIENKNFANIMREHFFNCWKKAKKIDFSQNKI
ncbi:MAG: TrmB family transcriptional regulator [Nanoarchaeota archaeon]|nr:TrmB family transcriptional regulator [Nanoarchaeota archaeon]